MHERLDAISLKCLSGFQVKHSHFLLSGNTPLHKIFKVFIKIMDRSDCLSVFAENSSDFFFGCYDSLPYLRAFILLILLQLCFLILRSVDPPHVRFA